MAQDNMGLFQPGTTFNDVGRTMGAERDQRIRQAMADNAGAGGNYYSSLVAKAAQQQAEALRAAAPMLAKGVPGLTGLVPGLDEDPRLQAARKRETDKADITKMLADFQADDGVISEKEMQMGFGELMSRGYVQEAQQFLVMAQSMAQTRQNETVANSKLLKAMAEGKATKELKNTQKAGEFKDSTGRRFTKFMNFYKDGTSEEVYVAQDGTQGVKPQGAVEPLGSKGLTAAERVGEAGETKETEKFVDTKASIAENLEGNLSTLRASQEMLRILPTIKTGGLQAMTKEMTDFFGITPANVGNFNTLAGRKIVSQIRQFGSQPTEGERKFLERVEAGLNQGNAVNEAILKDLVTVLEKKVNRESKYLSPGFTAKDYQKALSDRGTASSKESQAIINSWENPKQIKNTSEYNALPKGVTYITPNGDKKVKQ